MAVRDSNGNELVEGDTVMVIKDLKVKGAGMTLKRGRSFKGIHLTDDDEQIECREGRSVLVLRTCFLRKG
jgi:Uncharacterized Zn-ribbon-containing protein involved in phosphonate metabolism